MRIPKPMQCLCLRLLEVPLTQFTALPSSNLSATLQLDLEHALGADESSRYGSKVVLYTRLGEITLDGETMSFHEALEVPPSPSSSHHAAVTTSTVSVDADGLNPKPITDH